MPGPCLIVAKTLVERALKRDKSTLGLRYTKGTLGGRLRVIGCNKIIPNIIHLFYK